MAQTEAEEAEEAAAGVGNEPDAAVKGKYGRDGYQFSSGAECKAAAAVAIVESDDEVAAATGADGGP